MEGTETQETLAQRTVLGLLLLMFSGAVFVTAEPRFVYEIHEDLGALTYFVIGVLPSLVLYWIGGVLLVAPTIPLFFEKVWNENGKPNWLYWPIWFTGWIITFSAPLLAYNVVSKLVSS